MPCAEVVAAGIAITRARDADNKVLFFISYDIFYVDDFYSIRTAIADLQAFVHFGSTDGFHRFDCVRSIGSLSFICSERQRTAAARCV